MDFFGVFIRRPVFALMINLAMLVTGAFAYTTLNVEEMPSIEFPIISVATHLPGADPGEIENQITRPVEDAVAVLSGVRTIQSTSSQGASIVTVTFELNVNSNVALQECQTAVQNIFNTFPANTEQPKLVKYTTTDSPILKIAVSGQRSVRDLTDICKNQITDRLQSVDGVGQVKMSGGSLREIQIRLQADRLRAQQLTPSDVAQAVVDQNTVVPGGMVTSTYSQYQLQTNSALPTVAAFADVIVAERSPQLSSSTPSPSAEGVDVPPDYATSQVRVRDVGYVVDGVQEQNSMARLNGRETVVLSVYKSTGGNIMNVVAGVKAQLKALGDSLPSDIKFDIVEDDSVPVRKNVAELNQHLILGSTLACLTVLIFLGSFRHMVIAGVAIPISLVTTFAAMKLMGYTINTMTLLALMLAVGLVIDDAVVILENVTRLMDEKGLAPMDAALQGMQEMGFTVLATTLSLIVLFLPLSFMGGMVGAYFSSFGTTMAFCIFISMVVSFTLTPMMCARLLRAPRGPRKESKMTRVLQDAYIAILQVAIRFRFVVVLLCFACLFATAVLGAKVGKEFKAEDDVGQYNVSLQFPKGWPIGRNDQALKPVEAALRGLRGVTVVLTTIDDDEERVGYTQDDSIADARKALAPFKVFQPSVQGASTKAYQFAIQGDDRSVLQAASQKMLAELAKTPGFVDLGSDVQGAVPEVLVTLDKEKAADLQVDVKTASEALSMLVGGQKITQFTDGNQTYDVRMRLDASERDVPQSLNDLFVPGSGSEPLVPLMSVANVSTGLGPSTLHRYNRQPVVTLSANLTSVLPLQSAVDESKKVFKSLGLPQGYGVSEQGDSQMMAETAVAALQALVLAVLFMYMVLASQFESLLDPLIILLTLPLSVPFALFSLIVANMTLNITSLLGLFLLFGVVKKNAIMQIDHTNKLVEADVPVREAILQANRDRLRPILMTTITLVVALLPLAFSGPTGAMKAPMAVVVVGGQSLCLLLTLIVVPVALTYVADFQRIREWSVWKRFRR